MLPVLPALREALLPGGLRPADGGGGGGRLGAALPGGRRLALRRPGPGARPSGRRSSGWPRRPRFRTGSRAPAPGPGSGRALAAGGGLAARRMRTGALRPPGLTIRPGALPGSPPVLRRCGACWWWPGRLGWRPGPAARGPPGMGGDRARPRAAAGPAGAGGGGRPGRGGAAADAVAVAAGAGRLGGFRGPELTAPAPDMRDDRVTAGGACPNGCWSSVSRLAGRGPGNGRRNDAGHGRWDGAGRGDSRAHRAPEFGPVVSVVEGFCPRVEVLRPGACAIGVRGPARYFGGEGALAGKIIDAVTGGGIACSGGYRRRPFRRMSRGEHPAALTPPVPAAHQARPRWWRPARPGRSWPRSRSACWTARRRGSGGPSPPAGHQDAGRVRLACSDQPMVVNRFGAPGVIAHRLARGLDPRPLAAPPATRPTFRFRWNSTRPRARPSPRCSPPRRWPSGCMTAWRPVGSPACGYRCRRSGRTARRSPGCGGTTGCFPRWRWPSASAGSWPTGRPPSPALPSCPPPRRQQTGSGPGHCPPGGGGRAADGYPGGITLLRLVPDQLVRDQGTAARPVGRCGRQRPGGPGRRPGAGHARA